ncbi:hypothetical protein J7432_16890 [Xanthomonas axonopodis pv. begoniae]|nr:hypothetical protein [Xanthomonas axonopodis pv. begoniae]
MGLVKLRIPSVLSQYSESSNEFFDGLSFKRLMRFLMIKNSKIFNVFLILGLPFLGACKEDSSQKEAVASQSQDSQQKTNAFASKPESSMVSERLQSLSVARQNANAAPTPESVDIKKIAAGLKEGMPYGDLRKSVISGNWRPKEHPECKKNVIGDDFESICSKNPKQCAVCDELPELDVCSGDGHCITEFSSSDGSKVLKVSTYGEIQDGLVEGSQSRLFVSWWDVSPKAD